ncbi:MAG: diguanylate cyclase [Sideroxydans sp.]|jgi:diguanylate cyclase (GGDEF)-like protein/PAS domain S-box-containing protein
MQRFDHFTRTTKFITLTTLLLNLVVVVATAFTLYHLHASLQQKAATDTRNLSHVLDEHLASTFDNIDIALQHSRDEIAHLRNVHDNDTQRINNELARQKRHSPYLLSIRMTDAKGDWVYGSDYTPAAAAGVNYADREYFIRLRNDSQAGLVVVSPLFGRTTKKWIAIFAHRLSKPDGRFDGVVFGVLELEKFQGLLSNVDVGLNGSVALRNVTLNLLARNPKSDHPDIEVGKDTLSTPFKDALQANPTYGTYKSGSSSIDGMERTHSYRRIGSYPFYVNVGLATQDYLSPWYKAVWFAIALTVFFLLLSTLSARALLKVTRQQHRTEVELHRQKDYLRAIIENEPECVKLVAPDGSLEEMNAAGLHLLEVDTLAQAQHDGLASFIAPEHLTNFLALHQRVMHGESGTLEFVVIGKKGGHRWLETHAAPLFDDDGKVLSLLGITRDITDRKAFQEKLENQARTDYLTGVNNRGYFVQLAENELSRAKRYDKPLSLLMLDIDYFKQVNDTHGHKVGDRVLAGLTDICKQELRDIDIIGRMGGEEFAIVLPETAAHEALAAAERLRLSIAATPISLDQGLPIKVTVSIGVASLADKQDNLDVMMNKADKALYAAKHAGRNRVIAA